MDYVIAIPSTRRYDTINKKTCRMLRKYGIDMKRVYVFVPHNQYRKYKARFYTCNEVNVVIGKDGIKAQRNYISEYFADGQLIVCLDDDILRILELRVGVNKNLLRPIDCLESFILDTALILNEKKISLAGIFPVNNYHFLKLNKTFDLQYISGSFKIFINRKICENRVFHLLEDYETSLKYYLHDNGVLRYNNIVVENEFYDIKQYDKSLEEKKFEIMVFHEKYEDYCFLKKRRNILDLQFKKNI